MRQDATSAHDAAQPQSNFLVDSGTPSVAVVVVLQLQP